MAVQPQVTAGGSRQRLLLLAGVGAIGIILLLAVPQLLDRQAPATAPAPVAGPAPATTLPPQLIGPSTTLGPGGPGTVAAAKDPFRPLVTPGAAAVTGDQATAAPATGPAVQTTVPGAGQGTAVAPGGGDTAAEQRVTLLDIVSESGARAAKVEVDGTRYTVGEGETFAGDYRAVDVGSSCATFESSTSPFTLCEGEAVLK